jgi:hypothetical protein
VGNSTIPILGAMATAYPRPGPAREDDPERFLFLGRAHWPKSRGHLEAPAGA